MIHLSCRELAQGVPVAAKRRGDVMVIVFDEEQMAPMPFPERIILCDRLLKELLAPEEAAVAMHEVALHLAA